MSLYGGKLGGYERSLAPQGVARMRDRQGREFSVPVVEFTPSEAGELLTLLRDAKKTDEIGFLVERDGEKVGGGPVKVIVWGKTDADIWRPIDETRAIFIGWESAGIAAVFEATWVSGWAGMMPTLRKALKEIAAQTDFYNPHALRGLLEGRDRATAARVAGISLSLLNKACMSGKGSKRLSPAQWAALIDWANDPDAR